MVAELIQQLQEGFPLRSPVSGPGGRWKIGGTGPLPPPAQGQGRASRAVEVASRCCSHWGGSGWLPASSSCLHLFIAPAACFIYLFFGSCIPRSCVLCSAGRNTAAWPWTLPPTRTPTLM